MAGWREAPFFSARERAALAWAEILNASPLTGATDEECSRLEEHFSDEEIVEIGYAVLNISLRNPIPETPAPGLSFRYSKQTAYTGGMVVDTVCQCSPPLADNQTPPVVDAITRVRPSSATARPWRYIRS